MSSTNPSGLLPARLPNSLQTKQTDLLVQQLIDFGHPESTLPVLDIKIADENQLSLALKAMTIRSEEIPQTNKLIRSRLYHSSPGLDLRSWHMAEHVYRREPCPFPTRARGLFTFEDSSRSLGEGRHRIVSRGYDKFFNVGEVSWTGWDKLPSHSKGPYHLTMKTNGCIIFLSALTPSEILVTSKHAMDTEPDLTETNTEAGGTSERPVSHARMGERWLERHLRSVNLTKADLAHELWEANVTAVAELTDDTFEEHVLPTPENETGLNLHGLNLNHPILHTYPPEEVSRCARRWGLHPTPWKTVETVEEVRRECASIEQNGWPGRDGFVEGVVVRGHSPDDLMSDDHQARQSVFWKVKFEEPYLMYREWRELTRRILGEYDKVDRALLASAVKEGKSHDSSDAPTCFSERTFKLFKISINKIHKPESKLYVHWILDELLKDHNRFEEWKVNHGIVSTRDRFLEWRRTPPAQKILDTFLPTSHKSKLTSRSLSEKRTFDKTMLVPIAIPGCGKTSLALAMSSILECSHSQSDDIQAKKTGPMFIAELKKLLLDPSSPRLIFADKNNHLRNHREAILDLANELRQGVKVKDSSGSKKGQGSAKKPELILKQVDTRLIALVWDIPAYAMGDLQHLASERIIQRGTNHQSLRPELTPGGVEIHQVILKRFLNEFQDFDPLANNEDSGFDEVIQLRCAASMRTNLRLVMEKLHEISPELSLLPTDAQLSEALGKINDYRAKVRKEMKLDAHLQEPRYFGIRVSLELRKLVLEIFSQSSSHQSAPDRWLLDQFVALQRFTPVPHITLLHSKEVDSSAGTESESRLKELWNHYRSQARSGEVGKEELSVTLGPKIVWDGRAMAIEVSGLSPEAIVRWSDRPTTQNCIPHITVGTLSEEIRPVEAGMLLNKALVNLAASGSPGEGIHVLEIPVRTVCGSIRGLT